jgi:3-deoxy-manno-octulosonate cytidylyltransferase (CMP-KDO synthetase)
MRTLAVIPARLGATRLPRKPLRLVGGAPLIVRVWQRVTATAVAERVVVATDSEEIAAVVRERGGDVALTSADHASGTDRIAEVIARPALSAFDLIVNVQGDEPFVSDAAVLGAADLVRERGISLATAAAPASPAILDRPDIVKVILNNAGMAMYFSRAPVPFLRDDVNRPVRDLLVRQHIGVYAYSRDALRKWVALPVHDLERVEGLEQLRPLAAGMQMGVHLVTTAPLPGVDTEEDLARANEMWDDLYAGRI